VNRSALWSVIAVLGAVVVVAILAPFFVPVANRPTGPAGLTGEAVPLLTLRSLTGSPVSLAQYRGKVVLVNLWASWCPPCRAEMPELQRFFEAYGSRGVAVVGLNQGESAQRAAEFASSLRIRFPIWLDERQQYGREFLALGLPTTVVIGRDGIIVRGYDGALTLAQMRAAVAGLVPAR
jgi:thiol-disulfide isomerase/thioredoxin